MSRGNHRLENAKDSQRRPNGLTGASPPSPKYLWMTKIEGFIKGDGRSSIFLSLQNDHDG